jgi:hypothetical protein
LLESNRSVLRAYLYVFVQPRHKWPLYVFYYFYSCISMYRSHNLCLSYFLPISMSLLPISSPFHRDEACASLSGDLPVGVPLHLFQQSDS